MRKENDIPSTEVLSAARLIRTAILQSQERAVKAVNQEQLALYFGIGRFISQNTRNRNWGSGVIESISRTLRQELPGLRGFSERNLKNMRAFYEAWSTIETNSAVATAELQAKMAASRWVLLSTRPLTSSPPNCLKHSLRRRNWQSFLTGKMISFRF